MSLAFTFANVRIDGPLKHDWDVLLRPVGLFKVKLDTQTIYEEEEFCLVELGRQLDAWLRTGPNVDFSYDSEESETLGLLRFSRNDSGAWKITFAHRTGEHLVPEADLINAGRLYLSSLQTQLFPIVDLTEFLSAEQKRQEGESGRI